MRFTALARAARSAMVNGTSYAQPRMPTVAICLDGSSQEYFDAALAHNAMPNLQDILEDPSHAHGSVKSVIPSFTNPNNLAIATGAPPSVNGICGNYYLDESTGKEIMMNDAALLRCNTIFAELNKIGTPVTVLTAKDKLLNLLSCGAESSDTFLGFSVEKAASPETSAKLQKHLSAENIEAIMGRPPPGIYDPEISIYLLHAGAEVLGRQLQCVEESHSAPFMYLSTTDFVQHKYKPDDEEALKFYGQIDRIVGILNHSGAVIGITADHGMNSKALEDGSPKVLFLEDELVKRSFKAQVILPITDPYVVHHGALGGYAVVYLDDKSELAKCRSMIETLEGVDAAYTAEEACQKFQLPRDRVGDIIVLGDLATALGKTPDYHDLTSVPNLRTHGSQFEQDVPMIVNRRLKDEFAEKLEKGHLHNWSIMDVLCNGVL